MFLLMWLSHVVNCFDGRFETQSKLRSMVLLSNMGAEQRGRCHGDEQNVMNDTSGGGGGGQEFVILHTCEVMTVVV